MRATINKGWLLAFFFLPPLAVCASEEMAIKRKVPTINTTRDLESYLSSYVDINKKMAILLDYDGTLVQISGHPSEREMTNDMEDSLRQAANNPQLFVAIITGRSVSDIKGKVRIPNITFAGNHGIEIEGPDGTRSDFELSQQIKDAYKRILEELNKKVAKHGAWVEDKKVSLTFHYPETPAEYVESLRNEAIKIIEAEGWLAVDAHLAIEGKPPVNWNKGEAAKYILKKNFGEKWVDTVKEIYVGDDTSDEDVMKALHGIGKTFRIASDPEFETYADFRLPSFDKTLMILKWIQSVYT